MTARRHPAALLATASLTACATGGGTAPPSGPPNLATPAGRAAPAQAALIADCVAQAAAARTYDRVENTLRFTCNGDPARRFYEALGPWSASQRSQYDLADGGTLRVTRAVQQNLVGLDYCATDAAAAHRCTVVLNVGEFLGD